ncbi:hypothetical protein MUP01_08725 [Candidatus Bathyarchaeota archaeon]|nr:hypothetical protein [Candidatus Bathyarchaeota archaeon]
MPSELTSQKLVKINMDNCKLQKNAGQIVFHAALLALTSILVLQSLCVYQAQLPSVSADSSGLDLPTYPQPGNPPSVLGNVPFKVNVVFVGFPPNSIDTAEIYKQLPTNYTQINRGVYYDLKKWTQYSSFQIEYGFSGFDTPWQIFAGKFAEYIERNHQVDYAPYWLQEGLTYSGVTTTPVEQCWYVNAREAELWIKNNAPTGAFQDGYTILIMDTWHTTPKINAYYFYNGSVPSVPLPIDPSSGESQFMMGYGGYYRFLFIDLQAGPSIYRDTDSIKPLWLYDLPADAKDLSRDVGKIVKNTVELRFLPSYLYAPDYRPSYWVNVTIFNKDPTLPILFDMNRLLQEYRDFQPQSTFEGAFQTVQIQSDSELFAAVETATNVNGITDPDQVGNYFMQHLDGYVGSHGEDYVLPVFILGGYDLGGLLGRSNSDEHGNPAFVLECLNRKMGGFDLINKPWGVLNQPYSVNPGWIVWFTDPVMLDKNMMLTFDFHLLSGTAKVYIADAYNFKKWTDNGYDFNKANFRMVWSITTDQQLEFYTPSPNGKYYIIVENDGYTTTTFYGAVITSRIEGYTLTPLTIHETGHSLGLSHPHDGFSWILYQQGLPVDLPGEYDYWLWDFSTTPMTYAACNMRFDKLDRDSICRGVSATLLNETFSILKKTETKLGQLGFGSVPPQALANFTNAATKITESLALYSSTSPDYSSSAAKALEARESAENAYNELAVSIYNVTMKVKDVFGFAVSGANVTILLPNATNLNALTDSNGTAFFQGFPYGTYTATVTSMGQTSQIQFNAQDAGGRSPQVTLTLSIVVIAVTVGIVTAAVIGLTVAVVLHRRKQKSALPLTH